MSEVLFVGWVNQGNIPLVGETVKNQFIIRELEKYCRVRVLDFYHRKKRPWVYLRAAWMFVRYPQAHIIFSTSAKNVYVILRILKSFGIKRHIIHWVIGGAFGQLVKSGRFKADVFNYVDINLVQSRKMIAQLEEAGVHNAEYINNFKPITFIPDIDKCLEKRNAQGKTRFVFLSRVHPAKGCDYILQAAATLAEQGYRDKFIIDFYGEIDDDYRERFMEQVNSLDNVAYKGVLNLMDSAGYQVLSSYHAFLFPTFHPSEGFAGVFIDAFIAGLPVIASDWAYNREILDDGRLGVIVPVHRLDLLSDAMSDCMDGQLDLEGMARKAFAEASRYDAANVITKEFIHKLGLL